jgi:AraC-like DNA-binding protein
MVTTDVRQFEVVTHDILQAHEAIRDTFAGHRLLIRGNREGFTYRQATAEADVLAIDVLQHTMGVHEDVDPVHDTRFALLAGGQLEVAHAGEEIRSTGGDVLLFPQGVRFTCEWPVLDMHMVRLPTDEVARAAAARTGIDPADFRFESMAPLSPALAGYCRSTLRYVHVLFRGEDPAVANPLVRAAALEAAAVATLTTFPNTATIADHAWAGGRAAPAALRRTMDFIESHAAEPLTLAEITQASGIGARALQESFRRHHDTTPTAHLRRVRLERAHRELLAADPTRGVTVASIAARWGFPHAGRFATVYREVYGRSPRQALSS